MKKMITTLVLLPLTLIAFQACGPKFKSQEDCGFVQNVYGQRISWKGKFPVPIYIHSSVPEQFIPVIESSFRVWEESAGKQLFYIAGISGGPNEPRRDGVNTIYWMNTWESNRSQEQARTSVYWEGDEIRESDMRINAKDFTFYDQVPVDGKDVHLESLIVHELGHVLGLKHQDGASSVMATYLQSSTVRTTLTNNDLNSIRCEY